MRHHVGVYVFHNNNVFIERDKKKRKCKNNSNTFAQTLGHGAAFGSRRSWKTCSFTAVSVRATVAVVSSVVAQCRYAHTRTKPTLRTAWARDRGTRLVGRRGWRGGDKKERNNNSGVMANATGGSVRRQVHDVVSRFLRWRRITGRGEIPRALTPALPIECRYVTR